MSDEEDPVVVIDNGSGVCRAGFAGDDCPSVVLSSVVGYPKHKGVMLGMAQNDSYVGKDAQERRGILDLNYPMDRGIITDWDDMEKIWHHVFFNELRRDPKESHVLLSEPMLNPRNHREKLCEVMFETFQTPEFFVEIQPVLALHGKGTGTGTVVVSGEGLTQILPIFESCVISEAAMRLDLAGKDLTEHMMQLLTLRGYRFNTSADREALRDMKETHCYVAADFDKEVLSSRTSAPSLEPVSSSFGERVYHLPDGQEVTIRDERFQCPEALFRPWLLGKDCPGLHEAIYSSIMKSPIDTRRNLFAYIILSGGNTLFPGIAQRMMSEIRSLAPEVKRTVRVTESKDRADFVWIGGSILGSLSTFVGMSLTKAVYEDVGLSALPRSPV
ncbi:actin-2-like [Littorina saxatilis]|uniref:Actin n=1 Tax=Littorina saxatilis TaxID=31220 RepID=A0AAN9FZ93_9CAEN